MWMPVGLPDDAGLYTLLWRSPERRRLTGSMRKRALLPRVARVVAGSERRGGRDLRMRFCVSVGPGYGPGVDVLDGGALPADRGSRLGPVCVIVRPASIGRLAEAARWVGADGSRAEQLTQSTHRRPAAYVDGERISMVVSAANELGEPAEAHLHVGERGLLVLCPDAVAGTIRRAVAPVGTPGDAPVAVLAALAEISEEIVHRLAEAAMALDAGTTGLTSGAARRDISRVRTRLFGMQQLWLAHHRLLGEEILTVALSAAGQRQAR